MAKKTFIIICSICFFAAGPALALMRSDSYRIDADSINIGGLDEGSANYRLYETIGETGTGEGGSQTYRLNSGLRPMVEDGIISITVPDDVMMDPSIPGISGGTGSGSSQWTVMTDSAAGYTLEASAAATPALQCAYGGCSGEVFSDYTPVSGGSPDFDWLIEPSSSEFGLTPEGTDIVQKYKDNGLVCGTGNLDTPDKCWYGPSSTNETISQATEPNQPDGTATTIKFKAQSGSSHFQEEGGYQATITVTAIAN